MSPRTDVDLGATLAAAAAGRPPPADRWAQVSAGNVASLPMILAARYRPVAAEVLLDERLRAVSRSA